MNKADVKRPPFWLSLTVCLGLVAVFTYIRLGLGTNRLLGPTLGLPLLVCLWNRERALLWGMTVFFTALIFYQMFQATPPEYRDAQRWLFWSAIVSMLINVWIVTVVVHLFIGLQERLEHRNATLEVANAYLESANQELRDRERQISRQSAEIKEKELQIESMTKELAARRDG